MLNSTASSLATRLTALTMIYDGTSRQTRQRSKVKHNWEESQPIPNGYGLGQKHILRSGEDDHLPDGWSVSILLVLACSTLVHFTARRAGEQPTVDCFGALALCAPERSDFGPVVDIWPWGDRKMTPIMTHTCFTDNTK